MVAIPVSTKKVLIPKLGHYAHFIDRGRMRMRATYRSFRHPKAIIPATVLPVDSTGNASCNCPMDDNDQYGICGPAMCDHVDIILAWRQGKGTQLTTNVAALLKQYLAVSGGDNGTDENMLVGPSGIWKTGLAGDPKEVVIDALDIDVTNVLLAQYAIDQFYTIQMAWSVPDDFINGFAEGTSWLNADTPNPANGHYTPLADVTAVGVYRLWTWGTWCWVGPAFVGSVQPQCFIVFSANQFDPATGLDSKGRHITAQAAIWQQCGGNPIPQSVISSFPPVGGPPVPVPTPTPTPTPVPTPTPTPTPVPSGPQLATVLAAFAEEFTNEKKELPSYFAPFLKQQQVRFDAILNAAWGQGKMASLGDIDWMAVATELAKDLSFIQQIISLLPK